MTAAGDLIVLFTRYPAAGAVKTRLIPALGAEGAAAFHRRMTEFTLTQATLTGAAVQVRYTGGPVGRMRDWLGRECELAEQGPGDLGERMARAFGEAFARGARRVVVIGSDCTDNRSRNMVRALTLLKKKSTVIGPADDGGYYLIGLSRPRPELFEGVAWGTPRVLRQTLAASGEETALLPQLADVDRGEDLPAAISVVIPALDEARLIGSAIAGVQKGFAVECLVVDGGSRDRTVRIARQAGAEVLRSTPGKARQMNLGARRARGEILLFLHADTELPEGWDIRVRKLLKNPRVSLGAFRFRVKQRLPGIALVELGAGVRSSLLRLPYGDQALFMPRRLFLRIGGFPDVPILEDVLLVRKALRHGRLRMLDEPVLTSGRRWEKFGIVRTTMVNFFVMLAAACGVRASDLKRCYAEGRPSIGPLFGKNAAR